MKKTIINSMLLALCVLVVLPGAVYADGATDAQRLAILKQLRQQGLEARLNVLQQERACVYAAASLDALHACDQMSRQMMERMQDQQKASWESFKAANPPDNENAKH